MVARSNAADAKSELARTRQAQSAAADPAASAWVSASAGTGKTHVLTMRVLRLLLAGTKPERILCLTYTKAAAAEMSKRVYAELARWVTLPDAKLDKDLAQLTGREPGHDEMSLARTLFAAAIEAPGGLKVQTIHAFAERLLQRFPLEAGVPPGFAILDEEATRTLTREAIDAVLATATRTTSGPLKDALDTAIAFAAEDRFEEVLADALRYRGWLEAAHRLPGRSAADADGLAAVETLLRAHFAVGSRATRRSLASDMSRLLSDSDLKRIRDILHAGSKRDIQYGDAISAVLEATDAEARAIALGELLLDSKDAPRSTYLTKKLQEAHGDVEPALQRAGSRFAALWSELKGLDLVTATMALHRLADAVLQNYTDAKARRAGLDFDDLIRNTLSLLATPHSADWVHYKLDNGLDHVLVDESQDTSPDQWRIIEALVAEFFAGEGARDEPRTLFAVGDEKQSIYSFQGAAPEMFATMGRRFSGLARGAGAGWRSVALDVSFRTVEPVLGAVDRVFSEAGAREGLTAGGEPIKHVASRMGQAGLVEIWPTEGHADPGAPDAWSPLDEKTPASPVSRLATRIAETIDGWLKNGEELASEKRPIEPGDILILVRKRQPFAGPMVAALKARGIAVAGADRIRLADQIAVQDLIALADFLILPEDDLALATLLKSPLFGLDDDDLLTLARGRRGTLWKALIDNEAVKPAYRDAAATLRRWRRAADFSPPYEFFAAILDKDGMRKKLLARLGPDAADPIDEFLNLALSYDDAHAPSLAGFLDALRDGKREIKRDMEHGRNEVRVMTVHGAKGLEAPIVFLPDTCSSGSATRQGGKTLPLADLARPEGTPVPFMWTIKGSTDLGPVAKARADLDRRDAEERNRLLYVAMTRARDRLYVAGFENRRGIECGSWYEIVDRALADVLCEARDAAGRPVRRLQNAQTATPEPRRQSKDGLLLPVPPPPWASMPARREAQLAVPLAPSRLAPLETDEAGDPLPLQPPPDRLSEPAVRRAGDGADADSRFVRGTLTHALLEHLPGLDRKTWAAAAKAFVGVRGRALPARVRDSIVREVLHILADPQFAEVFGPGSRAEVPIVAEIPRPRGSGPPLRLTGQIDRLAATAKEVLIIDYKTNRVSPTSPDAVADVYLLQLAAYRLGIATIFPGKSVRAALLWTAAPSLMPVPDALLDKFAMRLWELDPTRLDV